jgi:hypothetical protein
MVVEVPMSAFVSFYYGSSLSLYLVLRLLPTFTTLLNSLFFSFFLLKDAYHPWTFGIFKFTPWTFQFWLWPYLNYFLLKSSNSTSFCRIYLNKVMDFCMWITWLLTKNEKKRFWRRMYHATRYGILLFFLINK